ncbi:DUF885 domain-containing protein [Nemorincola caseinilytica]|uniref:DUF885 domain-containing protein n=1 Tax=Nemorincola caseinilytica TaxID=2054315 RepID=A0ABP8NME4_9BACT
MRKFMAALGMSALLVSCGGESGKQEAKKNNGTALAEMLGRYWEDRLQLFPVEATGIGDTRYNDRLTITIAQSFRDSLDRFYGRYLGEAEQIDTAGLSADDKMSWRLFCHEMRMGMEGLKYPSHLLPISQFWAFTLELPQLGSGSGNQPFKTIADHDNWLKRLAAVPAWADTAIANMRKGTETGWVLPRSLVVKILPQLKAVVAANEEASIFYGPMKMLPEGTSDADKKRLDAAYREAIKNIVNPTYTRLHDFFEKEYLPKARGGSGIKEMPGGEDYYKYCIRLWTTTDLSPDSIYNIGLAEVARIEAEMNKVKDQVGYKGTLQSFFKFISDDKKFFPFTEPKQVIDSFWAIKKQEDPQLKKLFNNVPKTQFTIRQTEAFRAASASAEYNQGSEDGTRPGIFYVPIVDARKYNCVGMSTLFLHEAIPGHHYQISLQQENKDLPAFRRFLWYGAYGEGWAHYCETLGTDLGLYGDPYQYFGHLSDGIHRAIRLVVDVGMHHKGMTREEAIKYMLQHELVSEAEATAEIERYMAIPGQALSYKIGQMTISGERRKYEQQMGGKFNIASFHDEVLIDGCVPLNVLREKLAAWSTK